MTRLPSETMYFAVSWRGFGLRRLCVGIGRVFQNAGHSQKCVGDSFNFDRDVGWGRVTSVVVWCDFVRIVVFF